MFLKAAPRPLGAGVLRERATGPAFRHGWPAAKCSSKQHPRPLGRVCFGYGPRALRFVTVGLRPNVPHSSAPALGAGVLQVRATGTVFRHGWPSAKCSSKQRPRPLGRVRCDCGPVALRFVTVGLRPNAPHSSAPGPWWRVCFGSGPRTLCFVTVGLRPNAPQSIAPALGGGCVASAGHGHCVSSRLACGQILRKAALRPIARGSVSKFSTKNTPNVENTRKE